MTSIIHFLCRPRILSKALAASFLLNVATGAIADDLTVGEYQKYRDEPRIRSYLSGVFQGIHHANSLLELELKPRLYCPPDKLLLNVENVYQMIDATLKSKPTVAKASPITGIILVNLQQTFPCK